MKNKYLMLSLTIALVLMALVVTSYMNSASSNNRLSSGKKYTLPAPTKKGSVSLEAALNKRHSIREFSNKPLSRQELSQLLWAAQGAVASQGHRTTPSAGARYPLEIYIVVNKVDTLAPGIYYYQQSKHNLRHISAENVLHELAADAAGQMWIAEAPVVLVVAAQHSRTTSKYGSRGKRYVTIEAGHAAQNIYLQATALGLATTEVGAFNDDAVHRQLHMNRAHMPIIMMPIGHKKGGS